MDYKWRINQQVPLSELSSDMLDFLLEREASIDVLESSPDFREQVLTFCREGKVLDKKAKVELEIDLILYSPRDDMEFLSRLVNLDIKKDYSGSNLNETDLMNANLSGGYFKDTNFNKANLRYANLKRAFLKGANLEKAILDRANFSRSILIKANLTNASLVDTNFKGANLKEADLSNSTLTMCNLSHADLSGANLSGANLLMANLSNTKLEGADLSNTNLTRTNFINTDLSKVNLTNTNIQEAITQTTFEKIKSIFQKATTHFMGNS